MSSKSDRIDSGSTVHLYNTPKDKKTISTSHGDRKAKSLSKKSKCALIAFVVGGIAGIVITGLGATNAFGAVDSAGFIGSLAGSGVLTVFSIGGIIWIAVANCKTNHGRSDAVSDDSNTTERSDKSKTEEQSRTSSKDKASKSKGEAIYPQIGQEAIEFARKKLSEHSGVKATVFSAGWGGPSKTNQPVNQEIALLTALYWDVYFKALEQEVKKHAEPWSQPAVIQAADDLMKIGYAISCLTLEDLPKFIEFLDSKGVKRTYAEALTIQDSYQYRTYYNCTQTYHWIRGGIAWRKSEGNDEEGLFHPREVPKAHADRFYQEGTVQSGWRVLYNDYCDRVRLYVKEDELRGADNRHITWTKKDEGEKTFRQIPDTLPT